MKGRVKKTSAIAYAETEIGITQKEPGQMGKRRSRNKEEKASRIKK